MKVKYVTVGSNDDGQRLDNYLFKLLKGVPKSHIYRIIRSGEVRLDKKRAKANTRISEGMMVRIPPVEHKPINDYKPSDSLQQRLLNAIIFDNDDLLVINKPSGMAVHGGSGIKLGVIETLRHCYPKAKYLELVHRLDRETSGCLLIAKKRSVLKDLHQQLTNKQMKKTYWALLNGSWNGKPSRTVDKPLQKNTLKSGERMVVVDAEGKKALTYFRLLQSFNELSLVEASPVTGRTHQIRVHAQSMNMPICGDEKYTPQFVNKRLQQQGLTRLFLHAAQIAFTLDNKKVKFNAPLSEELQQFLDKLGD